MKVTVDSRFPLMDASSAVYPTIRVVGVDVVLAYHLPACRASAIVAFRHVKEWSYGSPNDEGLSSHPLWGKGLTFYNFHSVTHEEATATRWLATFHDGLLEIRAESIEVIAISAPGRPSESLNAVLGTGSNIILDEE